MGIKNVHAREIIDSRGYPTLEVEVDTARGKFTASVPSGKSTGIYEANELRDGGCRYLGKGVLKALRKVNEVIAPAIIGKDETDQAAIDKIMIDLDGTENKSNLGANAIVGVSLAVARAGAATTGLPLYKYFGHLAGNKDKFVLPVPAFNVINGGSHAGNKLAFQEFMILPTKASSFSEAMQIGAEVYHRLKSVINKKYGQGATHVGDEGGFTPDVQSNKESVELIMEAIREAGYNDKVVIGVDAAASEFFEDGKYDLNFKEKDNDGSQRITGEQLGQFFKDLVSEFPIVLIEDPFDQDDWQSWEKFTPTVSKHVEVVADDLTVTNPKRIKRAVEKRAASALLLKVNQIGSVTESIEAVKLSKSNGWGVMTSHRSGETEDCYIADLAVGLCTGLIKTGAPCRSERLAKYNQLLRIEEDLGSKAEYAGKNFRRPT